MSPDDLAWWLRIAESAARQAGELLIRERETEIVVNAEPERDVKLRADLASEKLVVEVLAARSTFPILSEEGGAIAGGDADQGLRWIIDPLDGSVNYLKGLPFCCVSIALWRGHEPVLGAVYDFNRAEMFTGIAGGGAWLNGGVIGTSTTATKRHAVLCTGFPVATDFSTDALIAYIDQVQHYKKVRLLGSAALSLCYVAAARADAYFERDVRIWDVAAGLAIVSGSGGRILRAASPTPQAVTVYAGNATLPEPRV